MPVYKDYCYARTQVDDARGVAWEAREAADQRKRTTLHPQTESRMRVSYGILSAIGLLPSLVNVVGKRPAVEDVRAEVKAIIRWKNDGLMDPGESAPELRSYFL